MVRVKNPKIHRVQKVGMVERHLERLRRQRRFYEEYPEMVDGTCPFAEVGVELSSGCLTDLGCGGCGWFRDYNDEVDLQEGCVIVNKEWS